MRKIPYAVAGALLAALAISSSHAQAPSGNAYPNKPIRIIAIGPGGTVDFGARVLAQALTNSLGTQLVVDNRPSGVVPGELAAKAPPDGYTLHFAGGTLWQTPLLQDRVPYDPIRDFAPISLVYSVPLVVVVHPTLQIKSVKELIDLAKRKPGTINYSVSNAGSSSSLGGALFAYMTGVDMVRVPFKSQSARTTSLLGGEVQLEFASAAGIVPFIKAGQLIPLAVTSAKPSALFPDLPTVGQTVPGYEADSTAGLFAPAKTPAAIISRLNQEVLRAVNQAQVKDRFINAGVEAVGSTPAQFAEHIKAEMARMGKVIKAMGLHEG